jgi:alginate O-acetyltransferase complex protein AlgI
MSLVHILAAIPLAVLCGRLAHWKGRGVLLLGISVVLIYGLQPALPIRNLDFWLPSLAIGLTLLTWAATQPYHRTAPTTDQTQSGVTPAWRTDLPVALLLAGIPLALSLTRYFSNLCCLTPTRPPQMWQVLIFLIIMAAFTLAFLRLVKNRLVLSTIMIVLVIGLLVILKSPSIAQKASILLRSVSGQPGEHALATDLVWLGFSYLAFRLVHGLRDFQGGKLPVYSLSEFVNYALFFPAYTSGPIDRAQRWINEYKTNKLPGSGDYLEGSQRILWGLFKKFVLADSLALLALNSLNAAQVQSSAWAWVLLYAYALRIYLDFSGYTDLAIGLGIFAGFRLPENFNAPYLKTNLTAFWNSWHITLAQWFRAYYFNPLTRFLRQRGGKLPVWLIIFLGQTTTMVLIGLWHGITLNFFLWGLWHGLGLFIHNRYAEWLKPHTVWSEGHPLYQRLAQVGGWLVTFNFVVLGWVWFALPEPNLSFSYFKQLFGL